VEKVTLFCNPASGGTFSSTAIEIIKWVKKIAVAQAKVSHILRPGNIAFKEQLKLVNGFKRKYRRIHALKKRKRLWNHFLNPLPRTLLKWVTKKPPMTHLMTNDPNDCATNVFQLSH
jgi:hypothetical protein